MGKERQKGYIIEVFILIIIKIFLIIILTIVAITLIIGLLGLSYSIIDMICEDIFDVGLTKIIKTYRKEKKNKAQYFTF